MPESKMETKRIITFTQAVREALDYCLGKDSSVFVIGEGVPDPKGIFGTTLGLQEKYSAKRVMDMPVSENGLTGVCIGAALSGLRPVLVHQRMDFSLLSMDQMINNGAKWFYMFGGQKSVPLVIRMLVGRGWGQGAQHSQNLQAVFAHIPGLKIVAPATAYDAKGLLISAIYDNNPVIFIEHRWLHNTSGEVPKKGYQINIGQAKIAARGKEVTIVTSSYMTLESLRAMTILKSFGIEVEVVDLRSLKPFDGKTIMKSVNKTGRLLVVDHDHRSLGLAAEVVAYVCERVYPSLRSKPERITLPDVPTPTSWKLAQKYYPKVRDIVERILRMLDKDRLFIEKVINTCKKKDGLPSDVCDLTFKGPF